MSFGRGLFAALLAASSCVSLVACGQSGETTGDGGGGGVVEAGGGGSSAEGGAAPGGGGAGGSVDKAMNCTDTFAEDLTAPYGRLDGKVLAIVKPTDQQCPFPNSDHVVIEAVANGKAYRLVVNVMSSFGDPDVFYLEKHAPLPAPKWSEGWHTDVELDYVSTLDVHSEDFTPFDMATLSDMIADRLDLDAPISVYSSTDGGSSTHEVHRKFPSEDGAIVLDPEGDDPLFLLFRFDNQLF